MSKKRILPVSALLLAVAALALVFGGAASRALASYRSQGDSTRSAEDDGISLEDSHDEEMARETSVGLD